MNNALRRAVRSAIATLALVDPDPAKRLAAAEQAFAAPDPEAIAALDTALGKETGRPRRRPPSARRAPPPSSPPTPPPPTSSPPSTSSPPTAAPTRSSSSRGLAASDQPELAAAATKAVARIQREQAMWGALQNVWYGLSLGSVLLLAAVGLAITFGVMGVINMAHGELMMLGAYTTFVIQELIRTHAPDLFDYSLFIAVPAAFLVSGAVGVAIERGIVRYLYGRPLETLLATWGVSLILQQAVRSIFGPNNREVGTPVLDVRAPSSSARCRSPGTASSSSSSASPSSSPCSCC